MLVKHSFVFNISICYFYNFVLQFKQKKQAYKNIANERKGVFEMKKAVSVSALAVIMALAVSFSSCGTVPYESKSDGTSQTSSVSQQEKFNSEENKEDNIMLMKKEELTLTQEWDKTFPKSDKVDHQKVTFINRYGITLAADMYIPKNAEGKLPAIAVSGPFGAVKEQCSGLYAQTMAERGFLTIAFDPSFTGESGGNVRYMASPDINTEDFMAAVDFLSLNEKVDPDRIGIIGICGWGGMALNTAALDTRVKATVVSTMYDMTRVNANGYFDEEDSEKARYQKKAAMNAQRLEDLKNGEYTRAGGCMPLPVPEEMPFYVKDYSDYYKGRAYHERSLNSNDGWNAIGCESFMNQPILQYSNEIRSAVLIMHGEKAHSLYFGQDAYNNMIKDSAYTDNKELLIIPDAVHTELYDNLDVIPFDKLQSFFEEYMN